MSVIQSDYNNLINIEGLKVFKEEIEKEIEGVNGSLLSPLDVTKTTGGIEEGTEYATGTLYDKMWRDMLNPTENPSLKDPSAVLSVQGDTLIESGSVIDKVFTVEFNQGEITPANGTSGKRSGVATSYSLNDSTQATNTFVKTVTPLNKTFQATVAYTEGEQPKNNKGEDYSTPLPSGEVQSNTINFEFVDAFWSNEDDCINIIKCPLISKFEFEKVFSFNGQTETNPEVFDVPANWEIFTIEVLNEFSNKYEDCSHEFEVTDVKHSDGGGNEVDYNRYSNIKGYTTGPRKIKITWE